MCLQDGKSDKVVRYFRLNRSGSLVEGVGARGLEDASVSALAGSVNRAQNGKLELAVSELD